jgi:hypothetical protein
LLWLRLGHDHVLRGVVGLDGYGHGDDRRNLVVPEVHTDLAWDTVKNVPGPIVGSKWLITAGASICLPLWKSLLGHLGGEEEHDAQIFESQTMLGRESI